MAKGKTVRDVKGEDPKPPTLTEINPGNIPILTIKLLDQINQNLIKLIVAVEKRNNGGC